MSNQLIVLNSSSCMATIASRYRTTVAIMNSIHDLWSENHPCTLFMVSLHPGYHDPQFRQAITFSGDGGALSASRTVCGYQGGLPGSASKRKEDVAANRLAEEPSRVSLDCHKIVNGGGPGGSQALVGFFCWGVI